MWQNNDNNNITTINKNIIYPVLDFKKDKAINTSKSQKLTLNREPMVAKATKFLKNLPVKYCNSKAFYFLRSKGLTDHEVQEALQRWSTICNEQQKSNKNKNKFAKLIKNWHFGKTKSELKKHIGALEQKCITEIEKKTSVTKISVLSNYTNFIKEEYQSFTSQQIQIFSSSSSFNLAVNENHQITSGTIKSNQQG